MPSLQKRQTILRAVTSWHGMFCYGCADRGEIRLVEVAWVRRENDSSFSWWPDDMSFVLHCPECIMRVAPTEEQPRLESLYERLRTIRDALGMDSPAGRQALGTLLRGYSTLFMHSWYPPPRGDAARDGRHDPYVERYSVHGTIVHEPGAAPDAAMVWPFPQYATEPAHATQTTVVVFLGQIARHPATPRAEVRQLWDASYPHRPPDSVRVGDWRLDAPQRRLLRDAEDLFEEAQGRPKRTKEDDSRFLERLERVLAEHEHDGVIINTQQMLADKMYIGKTVLNDMFNRVPGTRERFKQHQRGVH